MVDTDFIKNSDEFSNTDVLTAETQRSLYRFDRDDEAMRGVQ